MPPHHPQPDRRSQTALLHGICERHAGRFGAPRDRCRAAADRGRHRHCRLPPAGFRSIAMPCSITGSATGSTTKVSGFSAAARRQFQSFSAVVAISAPTLAKPCSPRRRFLRIVLPDQSRRRCGAGTTPNCLSRSRRLADNPDDAGGSSPSNGCCGCFTGCRAGLPVAAWRSTASSSLPPPPMPPTRADLPPQFALRPTVWWCRDAGRQLQCQPARSARPARRGGAGQLSSTAHRAKITTSTGGTGRWSSTSTATSCAPRCQPMLGLDDIGDRLLHPVAAHDPPPPGKEGSSFRAIKDALRLRHGAGPPDQDPGCGQPVAADLGYADTSAFYRAFVGGPAWRRSIIAGAGRAAGDNPTMVDNDGSHSGFRYRPKCDRLFDFRIGDNEEVWPVMIHGRCASCQTTVASRTWPPTGWRGPSQGVERRIP